MSGTVNWEFALESVGGDEEFLAEVCSDLLRDSERCIDDAEAGINERNFKKIDNAAHEVKGSALYLGLDDLRKASYELEMVGKEGQKDGANQNGLIEEAKVKFALFKSSISAVREEIVKKGYIQP